MRSMFKISEFTVQSRSNEFDCGVERVLLALNRQSHPAPTIPKTTSVMSQHSELEVNIMTHTWLCGVVMFHVQVVMFYASVEVFFPCYWDGGFFLCNGD